MFLKTEHLAEENTFFSGSGGKEVQEQTDKVGKYYN